MNITLAICPSWNVEYPPLGIAYIAAYMKGKGHNVNVFDFNAEAYHDAEKEYKAFWEMDFYHRESWNDKKQFHELHHEKLKDQVVAWSKRILINEPEIVGFSVFDSNKWASIMLARQLKEIKHDIKIIFGGPQFPSEFHEERLKNDPYTQDACSLLKEGTIDYLVLGEGEVTFCEVVDAIKQRRSIDNILSVLSYKNGRIHYVGKREPIKSLDEIPFPSFDLFPRKKYKELKIPIIFGRGCTGRCVFCHERMFWKIYRGRSAENIFEEIKKNIEKYGHTDFTNNDSLVNANPAQLKKLTQMILNDPFLITFFTFTMDSQEYNEYETEALDEAWKNKWLLATANDAVDDAEGTKNITDQFDRAYCINQIHQIHPSHRQPSHQVHNPFYDSQSHIIHKGNTAEYTPSAIDELFYKSTLPSSDDSILQFNLFPNYALDFNKFSLEHHDMGFTQYEDGFPRFACFFHGYYVENKLELKNMLSWCGMAKLSQHTTAELLKDMADAGCHILSYGLESGSQKILDKMKKDISVKEAARILRDTRKAGINTCVNIIVGFPGETFVDFMKTIKFIIRNRKNINTIGTGYPCVLQPHTELFENYKEYGIKSIDKDNALKWKSKQKMNSLKYRMLKLKILQKIVSKLELNRFDVMKTRTRGG